MAKSKLVQVNERIAETVTEGFRKIEDGVVGGYKKIEDGVVGGYKKIENGVVDGFNKMTDRVVDQFLTREGETMEEARQRMSGEHPAPGKEPADTDKP